MEFKIGGIAIARIAHSWAKSYLCFKRCIEAVCLVASYCEKPAKSAPHRQQGLVHATTSGQRGERASRLTFHHLTVLVIVATSRLMSMMLTKRKANAATTMAKCECMSSRKNSPKERKTVRKNQYPDFWQENQFSLSCSVKLPLDSLYQSSVLQFFSACIT